MPSLEALVREGHQIGRVVTQPDRARGRGQRLAPPPVKEAASRLGLAVWQPERPDAEQWLEVLAETGADALVVVAFAHKIPPPVLTYPRHGCINVHASLLPRWRGAAPIARAILEGDRITGVTIMRMDQGWDTGPILLQATEVIGDHETAASLHDRLAVRGAGLLLEALARLERGTLRPVAQPPTGATLAPRLGKEEGLVDWRAPAVRIERQVRAFTPWPGAYTTLDGRRVRLVEARVEPEPRPGVQPGAILGVDARTGALLVGCGAGSVLRLHRVQPEGGRVMTGLDLANGLRLTPGRHLGG